MQINKLTTDKRHSFKFKQADGKWTPHLIFIRQKGDKFLFEPYEDTESTRNETIYHFYVASQYDVEQGKHYQMNMKYVQWEIVAEDSTSDLEVY